MVEAAEAEFAQHGFSQGSLNVVARRGGVATPIETSSVLVAPSRPGDLLAIAQDRRIAVDRT